MKIPIEFKKLNLIAFGVALLLVLTLFGCRLSGGDQDPTAEGGAAGSQDQEPSQETGTNKETTPSQDEWDQMGPAKKLVADRSVYEQDKLELLTLHVKVQPQGDSMEDVNQDKYFNDDFTPIAAVTLSEPGHFFADGSDSATATLKSRGHSTMTSKQKSFKIKISDKTQLWRGQRILNLNKHPWDLTRLRNKLSFDLIKTIPNITSFRTAFVHLLVDDQNYGLFTHVENPNEHYLNSRGFDMEGNLYKAEFFEFYRDEEALKLAEDPSYDEKEFEKILEIKSENRNHAKLLKMLDDVNNTDLDIDQVFKRHFELDNYLTWLAINLLMYNNDTNSQNFLLYSPSDQKTWYFIPWDYDGAWDYYNQPQSKKTPRPRWWEGIANWWGVILHQRFLKKPGNLKLLQERVEQIKDKYFGKDKIKKLIDQYKALIFEDYIAKMPDFKRLPTIADDPEDKIAEAKGEIARLPEIIEQKYQQFIDALERPMPIYLGDPEVIRDGKKVLFLWDESFDLQGDDIYYDFALSSNPQFTKDDILYEEIELTKLSLILDKPKPGTYYFRIIIRDKKDPEHNWQIPFSKYRSEDGRYYGMKQFEIK